MHHKKILVKKYKVEKQKTSTFSYILTFEESDALLKIQIACLNFLNRRRCTHRENASKLIQSYFRNFINKKEQHEKNCSQT